MLISSCIDGRIRIRDHRFTNSGVTKTVREVLAALPGISQVTVNERIGSVLIIYSAAVATLQGIMDTIGEVLGEEQQAPTLPSGGPSPVTSGTCTFRLPARKAAVNMGMLATLVTSMIGIMIGLKKLHVAAGVIFLAFFGIHFFERRRAMFA